MPHVIVTKNYHIDIQGTEGAFIALADSLFSGGLDTMDAGDATDAVIRFAEQDGNMYEGECVVSSGGKAGPCNVKVWYDMDLFNWTEAF
jgi:hypothetical protein